MFLLGQIPAGFGLEARYKTADIAVSRRQWAAGVPGPYLKRDRQV